MPQDITLAEFRAQRPPTYPRLTLFGIPGCKPCAVMKAALLDACTRSGSLEAMLFVKDEAASFQAEDAAVNGIQITMFPTACLETSADSVAWLKGAGDKSGPYDSKRLALWLEARLRLGGGGDPSA